ncbi:MAG: type II secretion system minor pseudopilin GspI [Gammaproteobacteria bacterium]|nr:type II secretion system minor pseudopilin GspI [Gammaproteobacteria bacterium]
MSGNRGFTLLEVLVALFILAVALAAVMRNLTGAITTTGALRDRTLALWVADARLTHVETVTKWPGLGTGHTRMREDGRAFVVRTHVVRTALPNLRRVDIAVRRAHRSDTLMRLVGFVRQP